MSDFDMGYRDPIWQRIEQKDAEIERLKQYACQCEASVHSTQEGYANLQAEIERLNAELENREASHVRSLDLVERQVKLIAEKLAEIGRLKALITRAADGRRQG